MTANAPEGQTMGSGVDMAQAIAQAHLLGGLQQSITGLQGTASETLSLVREQGVQLNSLKTNDGKQDTRLDGHDREFGEVRILLADISAKLDSKGLTWPKLLAGGAALAAILSVAIAAIVAVSNGLSYLAEITERIG